jgi:AraC family transcriptional activator of pobA
MGDMSKISLYGTTEFGREYITPSAVLPYQYVSQILNEDEQHFSVFRRSEHPCNVDISANRSEFYKILLMTKGSGEFDYGLKTYQVKPGSLIFVRPAEVRACRETTEDQDGYYCIFNEGFCFADAGFLRDIKLLTLFAPDAHPVINLTDSQVVNIIGIFERLHFEFNNFKSDEIIRLYLKILLLESTRIRSVVRDAIKRTANIELTQRFQDLLEQQFIIVTNGHPIQVKSSSQFADKLTVHPNHLNASVKEVTGKSVSEVINNRLLTESQILLKYTDKHVAEIAYLLGFKAPSSFIHFFKKKSGLSPMRYKKGAKQ